MPVTRPRTRVSPAGSTSRRPGRGVRRCCPWSRWSPGSTGRASALWSPPRSLAGRPAPQSADLARVHRALPRARGPDGPGAGPADVPRPARPAGARCCCRWCCRRWSVGSPCSTPSVAAVCWATAWRCSACRSPSRTTAVVLAQAFVSLPFLVVSLEGTLRAVGQRYEVGRGDPGRAARRWCCGG